MMLQLGRFSARGTGAIVVCGPLGMCCVERDLADSAADVVWGRADIGQWLSQMVHFGRSIVFFDLSGVQPFLTVLGGAWVRGLSSGTQELQAWSAPIWAWAVDPGQWQMLEVSIGASSDCASGESWAVVAEDRMDAAWVRIGRGFDECERLPLPQVLGPASAVALASSDEGSPLSAEREDQALSPVDAALPVVASASGGVEEAGPFSTPGGFLWAPDPIPGAEPGLGSEAELEPTPVPQPESVPELAPLVESAPEPLPVLQPEPVQEPSPASQLAPVLGPASPAEPVANPEAFEATMTPEMLAQMGAANDAEATVLRRVEGHSSLGPTAFLLYGGTAPTEVTRDVVIGRDPDPRAISGRPAARTLRVVSPAIEISRSHCAVMVTAPGVWSLMDMGSANGTLLRHRDGTFEEVTPMVMFSLSDGDLIDVGEGTTIEFRVR
ncbi:FHA domain-containing protein [Schaalia cardiffensis]|uniref:FHA domain-containing protein n=1 Tax=Schaalia cardiffensis TaxID=181487 RepID=UPI003C7054C2